ncbi:Vhr2p KNAG_0L01530 [Huiozyma naganishii CBS 8797]|uniref:Transcription factor VHR1 n=1 Tax=Huiozyma naganishii (strain ATCC MYA-139 / BCRC 22969 / CBS 8797 / KCTC 17520 / NBRC 10181 / NCYC 3082 / Yp74L-3) TaxID=1071383 RepID=J7RS91_HUIN7|nr:hypothetical protein KNAG_0L01530 [Kazachstania naganishii CBS 8797]CCK72773.1 hypothetical protein KNAG_0L01530 [Kazachstania naganishii CBS 8797]
MGKGTTHRIRELLKFTNEKKWKQFSSRRLELIDRFGLSERKASEQDDNIRQIATLLREEFEFPESSALEFEKLVTAAVQSVRRNRKRSKKKLSELRLSSSSANSSTGSSPQHSPLSSLSSLSSPNTNVQQPFSLGKKELAPPRVQLERNPQLGVTTHPQPVLPPVAMINNDASLLRGVFTQLLNLPQGTPPGANPRSSLMQKLLRNVRNSTTFAKVVDGNVVTPRDLVPLGEMSIRSSVAFVVAQGDLANKGNVLQQTFHNSLAAHLFSALPMFATMRSELQLKFLYTVIGSIVKDFGFDATLYPLNEIIIHLGTNGPPQQTQQTTLPPLGNDVNGLKILSAVSSQVNISPQPILPNLIVKESFANGTLPQPIHQTL